MRNIRRNHVETKKTYYRPTLPYPERKEERKGGRKEKKKAGKHQKRLLLAKTK